MPGIPRLPPHFGISTPPVSRPDGSPGEVGSTPSTNATDHFEEAPRHRVSDPDTSPANRGFWRNLVDQPAVRATLLGAGGLASVMGGLAAPAVASATPVAMPDANEVAPKSVVYVGMNEGAEHEVKELRKRLGHDGVTFVKPSKTQDHVRHDGVTYDLTEKSGVESFVSALGLTGETADALVDNISTQDDEGKDELAKLVILLNQAENGERTIERIVFSGHSVGSGVWGDNNGSLDWSHLKKTMEIFPKAARQVEDVLMAACYSGGHRSMDDYRAIFPNLKTIWAYDGSAPGAWSGAVPHIMRWERGTRGSSSENLDRDVAKHTRKGENVATWSVSTGYDNGKEPNPLNRDMGSYSDTKAYVDAFRSGETAVENTQRGPLRTHYNNIQRLLGRHDLADDVRSDLESERDFVIRLIYYKNVKTFFQDVHSSSINTGFSDVGMTPPDFSTMSRKDALAKISEFNSKYDATANPSDTATYLKDLLHRGLNELDSDYVPESWI
jgi:hypothetical protein